MTVFHIAVSAVALIAGLLITSLLMAAEVAPSQPSAQANGALYW